MTQEFGWWVDLNKVTLTDGQVTWIHALPFGKYVHPLYGEMNFDPAKLTALAASVTNKTRGIDPDIDYDHKEDPAKGHQAAGWVKGADVRHDGLWLGVDFTADATKDIKDKKYRYFSADFVDEWTDPQGVVHKDVLNGGGLTNRPFMKNLMPVNLSELRFGEPNKEDKEVDGKKLRESLGLAETVTDDEVFTKLGDLAKAVTTLTEEKTKLTDEITKLKDPGPQIDPALAKLIEGSPAAKAMHEALEAERKKNGELAAAIRLAEVTNQINEVQQGKQFALAPVVKDELKDLLLKASPDAAKALTEFMGHIVSGTGLVDLSEKGFTGRRTEADGNSTRIFNEAVQAYLAENKGSSYGDAVEHVARTNPRLFAEYRESSYSFKS